MLAAQSKPEIALQQMRQALAEGVPPAVALMDPADGNDSKLRAGMSELGLCYAAAILPTTSVWRPGQAPLPPIRKSGRGRPATRLRRDQAHETGFGQSAGYRASRRGMAADRMARGKQRAAGLALPACGSARRAATPSEASRHRNSGC